MARPAATAPRERTRAGRTYDVQLLRLSLVACLAGLLALACGESPRDAGRDGAAGAGSEHGAAERAAAARLLQQATFGATPEEIERVLELGEAAWIDDQMRRAPTHHRGLLDELAASGEKNWTYDFRIEAWWRRSLWSEDQLRQRTAWALSQIFVVSDRADALMGDLEGLASYYDLLLDHAFGTYRELLEAVTLSPQMGAYLSMLQNQKPDPASSIFPDENFGREVMQLFSIGLVQLDADGSPRLDDDGRPLPTYGQAVVEGMAHAFTGWNYARADRWKADGPDSRPMEPWEDYHDREPKALFAGHRLEGGVDAREELDRVLDLLADHPNVGPFLCRQLIQRFVTSNPSAAYVARIASVFDDDGSGVRGNLGAVVRAILLDPEAREPGAAASGYGKLREPVLRMTALWRAYDGRSASGWVDFPWPDQILGQAPLRSPTVFNFYRPDHVPPGELADLGLAAPELALATHTYVTRLANELLLRTRADDGVAFGREEHEVAAALRIHDPVDPPESPGMVLDPSRGLPLDRDPRTWVEEIDVLLFAGSMSDGLGAELRAHVDEAPGDLAREALARELIFLAASAPEYAVQR